MSMKNDIREILNKRMIFWDGGSGTLLQSMGLRGGELPENWNLTHKEEVLRLYEGYLRTGADGITANTFGANRLKYPEGPGEVIRAGIALALQAREETGRDDAFIALDMGPSGKLLKPFGDLAFEDAVALFGEAARIGSEAGADLILIETMSDSYELKAAVLGAKENTDLPVMATVTLDKGGKLLTGGTIRSVVALLEGLRVDALGINCSLGPEEMLPMVEELVREASLPVIVMPNAGLPKTEEGVTRYDVGPEEFAASMAKIAALGVQMIGGCCGTTPEHIRKTIEVCKDLPFRPTTEKTHSYVTSFSQAVEIGGVPKIIGERLNPTGKKKMKEALLAGNFAYILSEAIRQEKKGAHILDVNVGLPEIDEPSVMERAITELQGVTALPLQIDTADPETLERALRVYNGKAMVNSVNGKKESLAAVLPLVAKYGGVMVGLTLDEDGIPESAEGRLAIAKRIYEEAEKYGIAKKDIVIDPLALTVSSDSAAAVVTLETVRRIREESGGHSILGISNVSFGLPRRELINAAFLAMALQNGLSCAILNPENEIIMDSYNASVTLLEYDMKCEGYMERYSGTAPEAEKAPKTAEAGLAESVLRGLAENAADAAKEELRSRTALDLIDHELIPALDEVGRGFEAGTVFLPQLLMSAEAAKAAFAVLKESMPDRQEGKKGRIIVATVKGDIHDIGKNIVKVLLENYGFEVLDLGKDVEPERVVQTIRETGIRLVGLSALMTTTVVCMKETIELIRQQCPGVKVLVGGAVLTQEYADAIGADYYAKDAMATVRYAEKT